MAAFNLMEAGFGVQRTPLLTRTPKTRWYEAPHVLKAHKKSLEVPMVCGKEFFNKDVSNLADKHCEKAVSETSGGCDKNVSISWCIGPTLKTLTLSNIAHFVLSLIIFLFAYRLSFSDGGPVYNFYLMWSFFFCLWCFHMYHEFQCFSYSTIPFLMQVGKWPFPWPFSSCGMRFPMWVSMSIIVSTINLASFVTPSLFAGVWFGQKSLMIQSEECLWRKVMSESVLSALSVPLDCLVLVCWLLTFLPVIHVFYALTPEGCQQLSKDGFNEHKERYNKELTMKVDNQDGQYQNGRYAYIAWSVPPHWLCYLTIPGRYRNVRLTGESFQTLAESVGMSSIHMLANEHAYARAESVLADAEARWLHKGEGEKGDMKEDIESFQTAFKHLASTLPRLNSRICLNGLVVGGFQFHMQVSVFALTTASLKASHQKISYMYEFQAWIAIVAALLKVLLTLPSIGNFFSKVYRFEGKLNKMLNRRGESDYEGECIDNEGESIKSLLRELNSFRWKAGLFTTCVFVVLYVLVWGFAKCAAIYWCHQGLWNAKWKVFSDLNFTAGCINVSFNGSSVAKCLS